MSPSSVSESHYELIRDAIFDNDRNRVAELLAVPGVDVDYFDAGGQTLLHLACFWGRMELVKVLLATGASLKTKNAANCTALDLATHWGHSAVAEIIRLRGGKSVWEDKFGALQVELEDLTLKLQHFETQNNHKRRQLDAMAMELQFSQTQLAEEKSARALAIELLDRAQQQFRTQMDAKERLEQERVSLIEQLTRAQIAEANAKKASERAFAEMAALKTHRDDILAQMQASVAQQEQVTRNWQRAEVAAAMSDSQRNFAFAERDQFHRVQLATLAELLVTTERLGAAEEELMTLKTDLAEHIFEMKREKRNQKHAAQAFATIRAKPTTYSRPSTTPVEMMISDKKARKAEEIQQLFQAAKATPKKMFSLAAREYGERVYHEEQRKIPVRAKRLQRVENQYRVHGLQAAIVDAEVFQEEFATTVRAFAASRSEKWQNLKRERDRQARFAANTLARPILTAPQAFAPLSDLEGTLNYSLYRKYALPISENTQKSGLRPVTSYSELRTQADLLSEMKKKSKEYPPEATEKIGPFLPMV